MVVVALVGITSAIALSSTSETIALAKFRADRAKLYLTVREARDLARDSKTGGVLIRHPVGTQDIEVVAASIGCGVPGATLSTTTFPSLNFDPAVNLMCFSANSTSGPPVKFANPQTALPEEVQALPDARIQDTWGEFGKEGALEGPACDTDDGLNCGK